MKTMIILLLMISNTYAMRCDGNLIREGDSIPYMMQQCGTPISMYPYVYLDKDGMEYRIYTGNNGLISRIEYTR